MGLITLVLGLPFAPVRGVISLGEMIQDQVEQEMHDLSSIRRELEAVEEARDAGRISAEEAAAISQQALDRLTRPAPDGIEET